MPNPAPSIKGPSFSPNYAVTQTGLIYPNNIDLIVWPSGYGYDLEDAGPGYLLKLTADQINGAVQGNRGGLVGVDILATYGVGQLGMPYKNCRNLYVSWSDNSWNAIGGELIITGFTGNYKIESETITAPAATDLGVLTTNTYQYVTNIVADAAGGGALTADLMIDLGYPGVTLPFNPDNKCSSFDASIQVAVAIGNITYDIFVDNFPRNVQTVQSPSSMATDWVSQTWSTYAPTAYMVNTLDAPPYPDLSGLTDSILVPVPFAVQNVYINVPQGGSTTDGSFIAIFLQDSIWFK